MLRWSNETATPVTVPVNLSLPQFEVKYIETDEYSKPRRGSGKFCTVSFITVVSLRLTSGVCKYGRAGIFTIFHAVVFLDSNYK